MPLPLPILDLQFTSISDLSAQVNADLSVDIPPDASLKKLLRAAEQYRKKGEDLHRAVDFEHAFIELAKAATIALERIPNHADYNTLLSAAQRRNLGLHGQDMLDNLSSIKPSLVERYEALNIARSDGRQPPIINEMDSSTPSTRQLEPPHGSVLFSRDSRHTDPVDLTGQIEREGDFPAASGGFANVWKGSWRSHDGRKKVAIKAVHVRLEDPKTEEKMTRRLRRELRVWVRLEHHNILPLTGVVRGFGPYVSMVCPWMENGTLQHYLERYPKLHLKGRLQLLHEISEGLAYLHSRDVVHGDLTGSNVLLDMYGTARISDFGLSKIVAEFQGTSYMTSSIGGNIRWTASDLYRLAAAESGVPPTITSASDVYSFGSVCLQAISGRVPYYDIQKDVQVVIAVYNGVKPSRPQDCNMPNELWHLIQHCWSEPGTRPSIQEVRRALQEVERTTSASAYATSSANMRLGDWVYATRKPLPPDSTRPYAPSQPQPEHVRSASSGPRSSNPLWHSPSEPNDMLSSAARTREHRSGRRRQGFWNKQGDHLVGWIMGEPDSGNLVYAPEHLKFPEDLQDYPEEGYMDEMGNYAPWAPRIPDRQSVGVNGRAPARPYESWIKYVT